MGALRIFLTEQEYELVEEQRFRGFASLHDATSFFQKKFLLYQLKKNRYDLGQVSEALHMNVDALQQELHRLDIQLG